MPSPIPPLFREMRDAVENHLSALEAASAVTEIENAPTRAECSAIQRVQKSLRQLLTTLKAEIADLG